MDRAQDEGAMLRIRLWLSDCPELGDLPWEFLYDKETIGSSRSRARHPVVRYLQLPNQPRPLSVTLPLLRILAIRFQANRLPGPRA